MVLDFRRQLANRYDLLPCRTAPQPVVAQRQSADEMKARGGEKGEGEKEGKKPRVAVRVIAAISSCTLQPRMQPFVVSLFVLWTVAFGTYGLTHVQKGSDWHSYLPRDSYLLDYLVSK
jgi:hypothetical protein